MTPIAIIGAGPAGTAAACALARAGRSVAVFERERETGHKLCGEFLGGPALDRLAALGISVEALGATSITQVRLHRGGRAVERRLPFRAAGLSRRALDTALRERARDLGADLQYGVRAAAATATTVSVDGAEIAAASVLLATGKHDLRGYQRPDIDVDTIGLKMHFRVPERTRAALAGTVEIFLFRDSYAGLQMVEDGRANLCLLTRRERFAAAGSWEGLVADLAREDAAFGRRLGGAVPLLDRPLAIARVPYGFVHSDAEAGGVFRLGDQMGVIPSFAGEGIGIALHSGLAAARCILTGGDAAAYHRLIRADIARPVARATALYRAGQSAMGQLGLMLLAQMVPGVLALVARATRVGGPADLMALGRSRAAGP